MKNQFKLAILAGMFGALTFTSCQNLEKELNSGDDKSRIKILENVKFNEKNNLMLFDYIKNGGKFILFLNDRYDVQKLYDSFTPQQNKELLDSLRLGNANPKVFRNINLENVDRTDLIDYLIGDENITKEQLGGNNGFQDFVQTLDPIETLRLVTNAKSDDVRFRIFANLVPSAENKYIIRNNLKGDGMYLGVWSTSQKKVLRLFSPEEKIDLAKNANNFVGDIFRDNMAENAHEFKDYFIELYKGATGYTPNKQVMDILPTDLKFKMFDGTTAQKIAALECIKLSQEKIAIVKKIAISEGDLKFLEACEKNKDWETIKKMFSVREWRRYSTLTKALGVIQGENKIIVRKRVDMGQGSAVDNGRRFMSKQNLGASTF